MPPSQQAQHKHTFWKDWINYDLSNDVNALLASREIQRSWNDILENADFPPTGSGMFNQWVAFNYRNSIMLTIRALTDTRKGTRSLMRLLQDLKKHQDLLQQLSIDPSLIETHIKQLEGTHKVRRFVNLNIAHIASQKPKVPLTFEEVFQAADNIYNIFHYWQQKICQLTAYPPSVTEIRRDPWEYLFTQPWITPKQAALIVDQRKAEHDDRIQELTV